MSTHSSGNEPDVPERLEIHNAATDEALARDGACAHVHLPTGRICTLDHGHAGSCDFDRPQDPS